MTENKLPNCPFCDGDKSYLRLNGMVFCEPCNVLVPKEIWKKRPKETDFEKKISNVSDVTKIQCSKGNYDVSPYMVGMANGLICAMAILRDEDPNYLNIPEKTEPSPDFPHIERQDILNWLKLKGQYTAWDNNLPPTMQCRGGFKSNEKGESTQLQMYKGTSAARSMENYKRLGRSTARNYTGRNGNSNGGFFTLCANKYRKYYISKFT